MSVVHLSLRWRKNVGRGHSEARGTNKGIPQSDVPWGPACHLAVLGRGSSFFLVSLENTRRKSTPEPSTEELSKKYCVYNDITACRPVARQRMRDMQLLLGNGCVQ
jgi:hypothetical protein